MKVILLYKSYHCSDQEYLVGVFSSYNKIDAYIEKKFKRKKINMGVTNFLKVGRISPIDLYTIEVVVDDILPPWMYEVSSKIEV